MIVHFQHVAIDIDNYSTELLNAEQLAVVQFCAAWKNGVSYFTVHTSGSTGVPKEITIGRKQALASVLLTKNALQLKANWNVLVCLNINSIASKMMLIRAMELGMNFYYVEPSNNPLLDFKNETNIDFISLVPLQLQSIMSNVVSKEKLNNVKKVLIGGAPINEHLIAQTASLKCEIYATYGMTETVSHVALRLLNKAQPQQYFTPLQGVEVKQNEHNCICIKAAVTNNKWIETNDIAEFASSKQFKILGRVDNVINSGGIKIYIEQIESIIADVFKQNGLTNQFFITAIPCEILGEEAVLVVEDKVWSLDKELLIKDIIKKSCPPFHTPKKIMYLQQFVTTQSMKIDRLSSKEILIKQYFV